MQIPPFASLTGDFCEHVRLSEDEQIVAVHLDFGAAVLRVQDLVTLGHVERDPLTVVLAELAVTDGEDVRLQDGLDTSVGESTTVLLLPAVAGGR